jgi:hypothetical protein
LKESDADYKKLDVYSSWQETYNGTLAIFPDYGMKIQTLLTLEEAKQVSEAKYVNNSSIVVVATVIGTKFSEKFVFAGDMETAGWQALLAKNNGFREGREKP